MIFPDVIVTVLFVRAGNSAQITSSLSATASDAKPNFSLMERFFFLLLFQNYLQYDFSWAQFKRSFMLSFWFHFENYLVSILLFLRGALNLRSSSTSRAASDLVLDYLCY